MADQPPTTIAIATATGIVALTMGYFLGQGASVGIGSARGGGSDRRKRESGKSDSEDSAESEVEGEVDVNVDAREEVKLVLAVRTDLGMGKGKMAAQCSHATLACYKYLRSRESASGLLRRWERGGQAKIAVQVRSEEDLDLLRAQAISLALCARVVHDAGRTQIAAGSATVLGVLGPKSLVDQVTGQLKLL